MSRNPWGTDPPPPTTESKFFNAARRTVTLLVEGAFDQSFWRMHCVCRICVMRGRKPIAQLIGPEALAEDEGRWSETLRARLYRHGTGLGQLRWLAQRENIALVFKKAAKREVKAFERYHDCVDDDWSPDRARAIQALINDSSAHHLKTTELDQRCATLPDVGPVQLCNGHDLIGFLVAWRLGRGLCRGCGLVRLFVRFQYVEVAITVLLERTQAVEVLAVHQVAAGIMSPMVLMLA